MNINQKTEEIYTPINFNSKALLTSEGWKPYMVERHHQKLDFMLHQIHINRVLNDKYERRDYVHLSAKHHFERYLYGVDYHRLKPLLLKNGVIEENGSYKVASEENGYRGECKSYRLTEKYDVEHIRILVDRGTLFNNIKRFRAADLAKEDDVTKWINYHVKDVGIHEEAAVAYVEAWYENALSNPASVKLKPKQRKKPFQEVLDNKKERYLHSIYTIANETAFNAKRRGRGRRVYHPLANLWRELRKFTYIKSRPEAKIYNLDVANSQPYCLNKIILDNFDYHALPTDAKTYVNLTANGTFYKHMTDLLNVPKTDVADFKVRLFANIYFARNDTSYFTHDAQAFIEQFSTVYQIIQREKKNDHTDLAVALQRIESEAIIDSVMTDLMHKYQDKYFFASIHDSVLCEEPFIDEVRDLMEKHMEAVVGMKPTIKNAEVFNQLKENYTLDVDDSIYEYPDILEWVEDLLGETSFNRLV